MRLRTTLPTIERTKAPRPRGLMAAFSLLELMISAAILMTFTGATLVAFTITNSLAVTTRNQTEARAIVNQTLNVLLQREWKVDTNNDFFTSSTPIVTHPQLWQYTKDGNTVEVIGTLTCWTEADPNGDDTRKVNVKLEYTYRGRLISMQTSTIRGRDY